MSYHRHNRQTQQAELDMTPMLDIVFIMLIFFIVTTSFVKESGVDVNAPQAQSAQPQNANIFVAITAEGDIWIDNRLVDIRSVRSIVARLHAESPESTVVIQSDQQTRTKELIGVMDQVRLAGVEKVAIAADITATQ
ncbi:ExbD/TolR family protein [Planctobacterium marinum]|uniref:ExbD/TolR family protein n=1 Tax=Planctobacterium marinum TaxID=1631968 RepID=UPI001E47A31C|nr:biopolymer transporter ExbD [Planctobacterium marinum]MCC2606983.1 biopolymer transporter ExbD [Planctobacterium marinum]